MEWVPSSLREYISRLRINGITEQKKVEIREIFERIVRAVDYMHSKKVKNQKTLKFLKKPNNMRPIGQICARISLEETVIRFVI